MQKKAFVCLSGGLDSTVALYLAADRFDGNVQAVSFDYGQRHKKEMEYARRSCDKLGIEHTIISLGGLLSGAGIMLTDSAVVVPDIAYADIKGVSPTYVPFRNGTMLASLAALAQKYVMEQIDKRVNTKAMDLMGEKQRVMLEAKDLVTIFAGQHAEDAANWAYPDCTFEFLGSMANSIYTGTYHTVRLEVPFVFCTKEEIVRKGLELKVPFEDSWSCYKGEELHCGVCPTCRSRKQAFADASDEPVDPTEYAA